MQNHKIHFTNPESKLEISADSLCKDIHSNMGGNVIVLA